MPFKCNASKKPITIIILAQKWHLILFFNPGFHQRLFVRHFLRPSLLITCFSSGRLHFFIKKLRKNLFSSGMSHNSFHDNYLILKYLISKYFQTDFIMPFRCNTSYFWIFLPRLECRQKARQRTGTLHMQAAHAKDGLRYFCGEKGRRNADHRSVPEGVNLIISYNRVGGGD